VRVWPIHWRRIETFVVHYWQWLWTAILLPVGLWFYKKHKDKGYDVAT